MWATAFSLVGFCSFSRVFVTTHMCTWMLGCHLLAVLWNEDIRKSKRFRRICTLLWESAEICWPALCGPLRDSGRRASTHFGVAYSLFLISVYKHNASSRKINTHAYFRLDTTKMYVIPVFVLDFQKMMSLKMQDKDLSALFQKGTNVEIPFSS